MDIKIIGDNGQEVVPESKPFVSEQSISAPVMPELESKAVGQVMGLEKESELGQYRDEIQTLLDYAKSQTTDHSLDNLKWVIRSLEYKIGTPPLSEKRISYLARYAYLLTEGKKIEKEKELFEK